MESFKFPASPGTPLFPLSPERVNGTRPPYNGQVMQSPSIPEFGKPSMTVDPFAISAKSSKSPFRHSRNNSDAVVQGMIARFDSMSIKDYQANHELAMKRVEIAREMAEIESKKLKEQMLSKEDDAKKLREETRKLKKELDEARERERKVVRRLDVVMEELHRSRETHNHTVTVYEKEIRRSRKEAFKSSSGIVKIQEELKATRNGLKMTQATLETEKTKTAKHEQEAFTAQYQLVGMQEEYRKAEERIKVLEQEREGLKHSLKEEEVARIAAEGRIALPPPAEGDDADLLSSPSKSPRKIVHNSDSEKENVVPKKALQLKALQEELSQERRKRQKAQDQVDFMKMECQFQCCSCRIAEQTGKLYVHDSSYLLEMERIKTSVPAQDAAMDIDDPEAQNKNTEPTENNTRTNMAFSPISGTSSDVPGEDLAYEESHLGRDSVLRSTPSIMDDPVVEKSEFIPRPSKEELDSSHTLLQQDLEHGIQSNFSLQTEESPEAADVIVMEPQTPTQYEFRTVTTTTTVPIMFSPAPVKIEQPSSLPSTPKTISHPGQYRMDASPFPSNALKADGTLDREAALELIRQRRGRARSVAMGQATPKKQMIEGNVRRDISAPAMKNQTWTQ